MKTRPKLLVIGHARHGKDTVCEYLARDYGFTFESSSHFVGKLIVYPALKDKYNYTSFSECYKDRVNHRKEWFELIAAYNTPDKTRLGVALYKQYDIYCGLRSREEFEALKAAKVFDYCVYVDASNRKPLEPETSMQLTKEDADFIIDNNGPEIQLVDHVFDLMQQIQFSQ